MAEFVWMPETRWPQAVASRNGRPELRCSILQRGCLWQILLPETAPGAFADACRHELGLTPVNHGVAAGRAPDGEEVALVWSGLDQFFLIGPGESLREPILRLRKCAHILAQGDGRRIVRLAGPDAAIRDALGGLVSIDLRPKAFPAGSAAATDLDHMMVNIWTDPRANAFHVAVFSSFAESLLLALAEAGFAAERCVK